MALDLRPLTLAELLDRAFSTYRRHLWLFVGIMALPSVLAVGSALLMQSSSAMTQSARPDELFTRILPLFAAGLLLTLMYAAVYAFALGATAIAVSERYLGRDATITSAYARVRRHAGRLVLLLIWVLLRLGGTFVLLIMLTGVIAAVLMAGSRLVGIVIFVLGVAASFLLPAFLGVRYGVAVPTLVLEGAPAGASLRRSVELTSGHLGRVFLLMLCAAVIAYASAALFEGPFVMAAFLAGPGTRAAMWWSVVGALSGGIGGMFSGPIMIIGLAFLYYDLRIRKEALDLQLMLDTLDAQASPALAPAASD